MANRPFTHRIGQYGMTSDYHRLLQADRRANSVPPEVNRLKVLALILMPAPLLLGLAWLLVGMVTKDQMVRDNSHLLLIWGLTAFGFNLWQAASGARSFLWLRRTILWALFAATIGMAASYASLGVDARQHAVASKPERVFELSKIRGNRGTFRRVIVWYQRADGSTVGNGRRGRPLPYANVCALVQQLDGPNGFRWVKVLERSRRPERGQLSWPIRREECFSGIPLSQLPR